MKILNLKILNKAEQIIRDLDFNENGINYIYGDVNDPKEKNKTSNSLGKTTLLKCIDYIYGANEDKGIIKEDIIGYKIQATVSLNGKNHFIERILGDSKSIKLDNEEISELGEYKEILGINRGLLSKQIYLKGKSTILGHNMKGFTQEDVINFLKLLELDEIIDNVNNIYRLQDDLASKKRIKGLEINNLTKNRIIKSNKELQAVLFNNKKDLDEVESKLSEIKENIRTIKTADNKSEILKSFNKKNIEFKQIENDIQMLIIEKERFEDYISESENYDIKPNELNIIFESAKFEIPELIKKEIDDVFNFHKAIVEERNDIILKDLKKINLEIEDKKLISEELKHELDELGGLISESEVYQENIGLLEHYTNQRDNLIRSNKGLEFIEGKIEEIKVIDGELSNQFSELSINVSELEEKIDIYRNVAYEFVVNVYGEKRDNYFQISSKLKHATTRPMNIDFYVKGQGGEGVDEVKKILIDVLVLKINKILEIFMQDSACFNGIDSRQVKTVLELIEKTAIENKKQAIVAINKYQLSGQETFADEIKNKSLIVLDEDNTLLGFEY